VLDALIQGVNIVELDPEDDSVGYGGLPNAEGIVQQVIMNRTRLGREMRELAQKRARKKDK